MNPVRIHEGRGLSRQNYFCHTVQCFYEEKWTACKVLLTLYLTLTPIFSGRKAKINLHSTTNLTVVMPISCLLPCGDPGIFVRGVGGGGVHVNLAKKSSDVLFFFAFFLVLSLFYRSLMVNFNEKYNFSRFRRDPNFSRGGGGGGGTCSRWGGGVQLLIPYRNPYNFVIFQGVRTPCPSLLWIRTWLRYI